MQAVFSFVHYMDASYIVHTTYTLHTHTHTLNTHAHTSLTWPDRFFLFVLGWGKHTQMIYTYTHTHTKHRCTRAHKERIMDKFAFHSVVLHIQGV